MSYFPARAQFRSDNAPEPHAHPQHPFANFCPHTAAAPPLPRIVPLPSTTLRSTPLQTSPRLHHHAACFRPSQPAPALPEGPKRPPAGPGTGSHRPKYAQPTHRPKYTQPTHRPPEHAQKKSGIRCRMPPHGTDAPPTRGRRPYRPLRAGRRTRPAYWPQSTPR